MTKAEFLEVIKDAPDDAPVFVVHDRIAFALLNISSVNYESPEELEERSIGDEPSGVWIYPGEEAWVG